MGRPASCLHAVVQPPSSPLPFSAYQQAEHPLNLLVIDGRPSKLYKNSDAHAAAERGDGFISWAVQPEATIDRFDARALLDMYRDYDSETAPKKAKTPEEERLAKVGGKCGQGAFVYGCV